ncbi:MAG: ribosomal RNA small subunit methyltransferase A [Nanoarchaeota archaeon]|nr:ribosomal RNA small subunit methyltransferase A [Nanoarchaeota archaeon]
MKPKLSQVFLHNEQTLEKISKAVNASKSDVVFEIGGGKGVLTKYLVKAAKKVIVCELDEKLVPFIKEYTLNIINKSILKTEFPKEVTLIVGNIPYHLSGKITEKVLREAKRAVILYQKEFADRLVARPGSKDYSRISVLAQTLSNPRLLFDVNRHDFTPVPKVDSTLVEFTPKKNEYDEGFFKFISIIFQFKNKTLKNALINGRRHWTKEQDKRKLKPLIDKLVDRKVVTLSVEELKKEYKKIKRLI